MSVDVPSGVAAGLAGGFVMVATGRLLALAGVTLRLEVVRVWGAFLRGRRRDEVALGWAAHLLLSAVVGVCYAIGFQLVGASERLALWGLLGGLAHWLVAGLALGAAGPLHPRDPVASAPGFFGRDLGAGEVAGFLLAHLAFGAATGATYAVLRAGPGGPIL